MTNEEILTVVGELLAGVGAALIRGTPERIPFEALSVLARVVVHHAGPDRARALVEAEIRNARAEADAIERARFGPEGDEGG